MATKLKHFDLNMMPDICDKITSSSNTEAGKLDWLTSSTLFTILKENVVYIETKHTSHRDITPVMTSNVTTCINCKNWKVMTHDIYTMLCLTVTRSDFWWHLSWFHCL
jgi:hypothetical protein